MTSNKVLHFLADKAVWIGLALRIFLAWFLPWALDDERFIPGVAYTDIDYYVFTDAAVHVQQGKTPYERLTYRYTPFLAAFLALLPSQKIGRYIFCLADTLCGWLILRFRRQTRAIASTSEESWLSPKLLDAVWWLYNPLAINICTRGSAESLVVLLPVLLTVWVTTNLQEKNKYLAAALAGLCHGVAIHAKLYPIIYSLSFMTSFAVLENNKIERPGVVSILFAWIKRLLRPAPLIFAITFVLTFVFLTYLAVAFYGPLALEEGLLYHFSRVDHRHNYSMHWYWIYLTRGLESANMALAGRLLLLPQLLLLFFTSLGVAPRNLSLALFIQTFLFVTHNKVITAQYFTWYLCLLPLCSDSFVWRTQRIARAVLFLLVSIAGWLASAYCLEMQGMAVHRIVWFASMVFFVANVNLLGALLMGVKTTSLEKAKKA